MVVVHVDEKWWFSIETQWMTMPAEDDTPVKAEVSKRYVKKLMILGAFGTPTPNHDGNIGLFPLVNKYVADRTTAEAEKNKIGVEPVNVTAEVYVKIIISDVIPAIRSAYANEEKVVIQQDNAPGHVSGAARQQLTELANKDGLKPYIVFRNQPPRSPDTNVCDLAMFNKLNKHFRRIRAAAMIEQIRQWSAERRAAQTAMPMDEGPGADSEDDRGTIAVNLGPLFAAAAPPQDGGGAEADDAAPAVAAPVVRRRTRNCRPAKTQQHTCISCGSKNLINGSVECGWRGGLHCLQCHAGTGRRIMPEPLNPGDPMTDEEIWVCSRCFGLACERVAPESRAICLLCHGAGACEECLLTGLSAQCPHKAFCARSGGSFHEPCLQKFGPIVEHEFWCCPMCRANGYAEQVQVEGIDFSGVTHGTSTYKSLMLTGAAAFNMLTRQDNEDVFKLLNHTLRSIIMQDGGSQYNLHDKVNEMELAAKIAQYPVIKCTCGDLDSVCTFR